ncbi:MAG: cache domain-containing protein, partial [Deltaproteobacteria bacterium]|nr:cache domain-containing protein [Deltaproteobacteria bacterium]
MPYVYFANKIFLTFAQEQNYEMDIGNSSQSTMINQKTHVKKFLHIFLPVTLLLIVLSIVFYQRELAAHRERVTTREMHTLENRRETVTNLLKSVVSDLRILTSLQYHNGEPAVVPRLELQFQKNSPCFQEAFRLQAGEFHMSHFDLEMKKGKITYPPTPVICFGMPVVDRSGRKKGAIMINYLGDQLLQTLKKPGEDDRQSLFLLNSEGYWLLGPSPQVEWGFLYPDRKEQTLKTRFPAAWNEICAGENGHFADAAGLFTFI